MISWIIPAYNEEKIIEHTLTKVTELLHGSDYEIIVSDDGSSDQTIKISKKFENVNVIKNLHTGRGGAVLNALKEIHGDVVVLSSADIIFEKNFFLDLINKMKLVDVILLSKNLPSSNIYERSKVRTITSKFFSKVTNKIFNLDYNDSQGAKIFKKSLVMHIVNKCRESGYLIDFEITLLANRKGFKIIEMPWTLIDRQNLGILLKSGQIITSLLRIWKRDRNKHYAA